MTKKIFEALRDCTSKIKDLTPDEAKISEMHSLLSGIYRLAKIGDDEGISHIKLEAENLPEDTAYEKAFKESIYMWMNGSDINEASDHAAGRYFEENPSGYDAAIFFAAVFSIKKILERELPFCFIDNYLQHLLPDGCRWDEEDKIEDEIKHRFDDIKICNLIEKKDPVSKEIGKRISRKLPVYGDGALQLILKELTYPDLEKVLYALPEETEDRIMSNLNSYYIPIIKGDCILNKDTVSLSDIRTAVKKFEEAINAYDGDPALEAEYER